MSGSELSELQARMAQALRVGGSLEQQAPWVEFAGQHISGNQRLSPVEQLEIYREQFWLRHTSSLVEDFPGVGGILGQKDWERLAEAYLLTVTPDSYTLRDLGHRMPELIQGLEWLPHRELCFDMARLELAYVEAFDALDTPPLQPERLGAIPEPRLPEALFVLAPCVRLLQVKHPVADLRRALLQAGDEAVTIPEAEAQNLVVYRKDLGLWDMKLSPVAFRLLAELGVGAPLGLAADRAGATPEAASEIAEKIGSWFQEWTFKGLVSDIRLP